MHRLPASAALALSLLLTEGCTMPAASSPEQTETPGAKPAMTEPATSGDPSVAPALAGLCKPDAVKARAQMLASAINAGDPANVVAQFDDGNVHWDVYLTRPGGGALRNVEGVQAFVAKLRRDGIRWHLVQVDPPRGNAGLPDSAVYGAAISIEDGNGVRTSTMKLVIDCTSGGILRAAGPES